MGDSQWMPQIRQATCTGCGNCIAACPTGSLGQQHGKAFLLYPEKCTYCAACETICPVNAIELPYIVLKIGEPYQGES